MKAQPLLRRAIGRFAILSLILSLAGSWAGAPTFSAAPAAPAAFADSSFQQLWERTDAPVQAGQVQRSWYWGPQPGTTLNEKYAGSKTGTRLVQYFDKARMEVNNPQGDRASEWFVTTGLLVAEMVSGKQQVGDKQFVAQRPAEIAVGGDGLTADPDAPTYTSFRPVASLRGPGDNRAANRMGQSITATIDRAGRTGDNPALGLYAGAKVAAYSDVLGHNIPQAMWDFLNLKGVVRRNGANLDGQRLADWVFVMGYPITEPYWARVKINGVYQDALFQMYERRSLAYVPAMPRGWQVQMGNVGQHYYQWLYGGPLPSPVVPLTTPTSVASAGTLPPSVDAVVTPLEVAAGAPVSVEISGMRPNEAIVSWFTAPDGEATGAPFNMTAGPDGHVRNISISTIGMSAGQWAVTYHGKSSNHESVAYFVVAPAGPATATRAATTTPTLPRGTTTTPPRSGTPMPATPVRTPTPTRPPAPRGSATPTPTFPVVPTQPAGGLLLSVQPGYGPPSGSFTFSARGLQPGEPVQVTFTDPGGQTLYPSGSNGRFTASSGGAFSLTIEPDTAFSSPALGTWLFEIDGLSSGLQGVVGFTLR